MAMRGFLPAVRVVPRNSKVPISGGSFAKALGPTCLRLDYLAFFTDRREYISHRTSIDMRITQHNTPNPGFFTDLNFFFFDLLRLPPPAAEPDCNVASGDDRGWSWLVLPLLFFARCSMALGVLGASKGHLRSVTASYDSSRSLGPINSLSRVPGPCNLPSRDTS